MTRSVKREFDYRPVSGTRIRKGRSWNYNPKRRNKRHLRGGSGGQTVGCLFSEQQKLTVDLEEGMSVLAVRSLVCL
ncbi:MAG: hypothetical protein U5K84_07350 [Alkalibacterium sp.]|nr:hypothetical protein [Alkalibacterium sp.]